MEKLPAPDRAIWEWIDQAQGFLRASNWVAVGASTGALEVAMQNASNAELLYVTIAAPTIGATTPGTAQYHLVTDLAIFNFATALPSTFSLVIAGPAAALFGANSTIVDPLAPLSAAIIAAAIGVLTDAGGNVATAFVSGSKASRRTEQV